MTEVCVENEVIATVKGEAYSKLPKDLYIPPHALRVFLETFEGPLDLLLYLIKRQNLNILDIPIAKVTQQYVEYVELMREMEIELAAEYLLMAAMLAEIKSRMLLPRVTDSEEEDDPRAELVRRLQEYERIKKAAETLDQLPRVERDIFAVEADEGDIEAPKQYPTVEMQELLMALREVFQRAKLLEHHAIQRETLSIRERMTIVLDRVNSEQFTAFSELFTPEEGRMGVVVTFIAILELMRQTMIEMVQAEPFGMIRIKGTSKNSNLKTCEAQ